MKMTICETESTKLEALNKSRKELEKFDIYRYPATTKRIKSVSILKKKIAEFFEQYGIDTNSLDSPDSLPLPSDLAMFLGYPSYRAMATAINSPTDPEWSAELERAVEHINNLLMRTQLRMAMDNSDLKGVDSVIKRLDKINDTSRPREADPKNQVNIQINIEHKKKIDDFVTDRIENLMSNLGKLDMTDDEDKEDRVDDIDYEEVLDD